MFWLPQLFASSVHADIIYYDLDVITNYFASHNMTPTVEIPQVRAIRRGHLLPVLCSPPPLLRQ